MSCRRFISIPVLSVILVVGFVYYVTVFVFIEDWVGLQSSAGTLNALVFSFLSSLCFLAFSVCVLKDPDRVPPSYAPDVEDSGRNHNDATRRCDKCSAYKPPRTHHCRVCKRCVLKMDHHCVWINNCVGYANYKTFFTLVVYATMASIYSTVMLVCNVFKKRGDNYDKKLPNKIFYISCGALLVGLNLTLGTLLGWHIYLISHNMTTIEHYEGKRAAWLARKSGQSYRHQFDLGFYKNITSVLGPNMIKWLCPTSTGHLKDGISFATTRDS